MRVREPGALHVDVLVGRVVIAQVADIDAEEDVTSQLGKRAHLSLRPSENGIDDASATRSRATR